MDSQIKNCAVLKQWSNMSDIFLSLISHPLRPVKEDLDICNSLIKKIKKDNLNSVILGVTPEYYHLEWKDNTNLIAIDKNIDMIKNVWPGLQENVLHTSWEDINLNKNSVDILLCDGGLHLLNYPLGLSNLINKLNNIINVDGYVLVRLFVPKEDDTVEKILNELKNCKIPTLNFAKMRLASALQNNVNDGISLDIIWNTLHTIEEDQEKLAQLLNWDFNHLQAINVYKNSNVKYHLLTETETINAFCDENDNFFKLDSIHYPNYFDGERYPTLIFQKIK